MSSVKRAFIDPELCRQCQKCIPEKSCPVKAIEDDEGQRYVSTMCTGCAQCLVQCPYQAVRLI